MELSTYQLLLTILRTARVTPEEFFGKSRIERIVNARVLFNEYCLQAGCSYRQITAFTGQHHSVPGYYSQQYANFIRYSPEFRRLNEKVNIEIKKVKEKVKMEKIIVNGKEYFPASEVENLVKAAVDESVQAIMEVQKIKAESSSSNENDVNELSSGVLAYVKAKANGGELGGKSLDFEAIPSFTASGPLGGKTIQPIKL